MSKKCSLIFNFISKSNMKSFSAFCSDIWIKLSSCFLKPQVFETLGSESHLKVYRLSLTFEPNQRQGGNSKCSAQFTAISPSLIDTFSYL